MLRRLPLGLVESKSEHMSDAKFKAMIPLFVRNKPGFSHNCGICSMFISGGECTVVQGDICPDTGTCDYWAKGSNAKASDKHTKRLSHDEAGYIKHEGKINCSSCKFVNGNYCDLWMGAVGPGDCCISWNASE